MSLIVPTTAIAIRIHELFQPTEDGSIFTHSSVALEWLVFHGVAAVAFLLLGTIQVLPFLHRRTRRWHRQIGRIALPLGVIGATNGLWITLAYPGNSGPILFWGRLAASFFWILAMGMAIKSIVTRDWASHGAWMIRAYAIALPAATLPYLLIPIVIVFGETQPVLEEIVQALAWPLHVLGAEWIRRQPATTRLRAAA